MAEKDRPRAPISLRRRLRQLKLDPRSCFPRLRYMRSLAAEWSDLVLAKLRSLRWFTVVLGIGNVGVVLIGLYLMAFWLFRCPGEVKLPFAVVSLVAGIRIMCIVGAGFAQGATAATIVKYPSESSVVLDAVIRQERRMRYRRWLWWTRFGMGVTVLQLVGAVYLTFIIVKDFSYDGESRRCFSGWDIESRGRKWILMVSFIVTAWLVVIIQCFTGSDVLRWRSFYATHDAAWKAHYLEVFDHGIREALCCLGRVKYLSVLEEDEVYSVARLLGDLVAYRATGTGHLEFLAGLALLQRQRQRQSSNMYVEPFEAPQARIREASACHQFAEAAYTGLLLDFGRNPVLFPCAWIYRQGILTPWTRNRRPVLEGDNCWRGHAAAFLKYVNLPPNALRRGRVSQTKREAAFFVVVLHHVRSVVITVRGTESPEDLLTDVLCRECTLGEDDLDGLINSSHLPVEVREKVLTSCPHYGHSGIVQSARELFLQIDGLPKIKDCFSSETTGFLSSLMGTGQECHGYKICIVGHSLGGSVATLLGLRLFRRYPNLHVYCYGALPCVDSIVAEACSSFVTSIVYNDEFSARLSVNSIIRLRAAAITALSDDSLADSDMISRLARRISHINNQQERKENLTGTSSDSSMPNMENNHAYRNNLKYTVKGGGFLCAHAVSCMVTMPAANCTSSNLRTDSSEVSTDVMLESECYSGVGGSTFISGVNEPDQVFHSREETSLIGSLNSDNGRMGVDESNNRDVLENNVYSSSFEGSGDSISFDDIKCQLKNKVSPSCETSTGDPPEMFLPGLIVHIVPEERSLLPLWKTWRLRDQKQGYRAFLANREHFKEIIVTPYMFLDHLPWRCHHAMQRVLETQKAEGPIVDNMLNGVHVV